MGGSLPFWSGVVVSLRPLSVCHGSLWLVTALFPSLSLSLPVPIFSWLLLLLRQVPWVCCLTFPMVVRTLAVGPGVSYASCLPFRLLVYWFRWLLFSTRVPYLRDGVTPAGSRIVCLFVLDRNEGLVSPFGSGTLVSSWLDLPPLSTGIFAPCRGLGLSFVPYPLFCRLGLVPRSVAQLCALQPLVPSFRVYLSEAAGFGGFLVLSIVLPCP